MSWNITMVITFGMACMTICFCTFVNRKKPRSERCASCEARLKIDGQEPIYD